VNTLFTGSRKCRKPNHHRWPLHRAYISKPKLVGVVFVFIFFSVAAMYDGLALSVSNPKLDRCLIV
jgi:hypothetical protein